MGSLVLECADASPFWRLLDSLLPNGRITRRMKDCEYDNRLLFDRKVNRLGKLPSQDAAKAGTDRLICKWTFEDSSIRGANLFQKLKSEPNLFRLIPLKGSLNIRFDGWFCFKPILLQFFFRERRLITSKAGWEADGSCR